MSRRERSGSTRGRAAEPMAHIGHRHDRLQHILLEELNGLVRGEVTDPRLDPVGFSRIELSPDYGTARAWYVVAGEGAPDRATRQRIEAALERAQGFLRARLAEQLDLKRCPLLRFAWDPDAFAHPPAPSEALPLDVPPEVAAEAAEDDADVEGEAAAPDADHPSY